MSRLLVFILIIIVIVVVILLWIKRHQHYDEGEFAQDRILIAIPCIDRDASYVDAQYATIKHLLKRKNVALLVLTRETDTKTIHNWTTYQTGNDKIMIKLFPPYQILERHNMVALAQKRNYALDYAKTHHYDYVFFIDADILVQPSTLDKLHSFLRTNGDVALVPYKVRWLGYPAIGAFVNGTMKVIPVESQESYYRCHLGGMGCTLIKKTAFDIPFENKRLETDTDFVYGEDIGFFVNLYHANKHAYYLSGHPIRHLGS